MGFPSTKYYSPRKTYCGTPPRYVQQAGLALMTHRRPVCFCILVIAMGVLAGCKTAPKPVPSLPVVALPSGAPGLGEIIADLRANDEALKDIRAAATFTLEAPTKLKSIQRFDSGTVAYRRPADLYVVGKNVLGAKLFQLTSRGPDFVIEFPAAQDTDDRYFCSNEGEDIAKFPFSVTPADIAREMFMPIDWGETPEQSLRLTGFEDMSGNATVEFTIKNNLNRRLVVAGKPWVIVHNILTGTGGEVLSETSMKNYVESAGVRFPSSVEAWFPGENTRMKFELRNVRINTGLPDSLFAIRWPAGQ